jgi:hypothetical protein
VPCWHSPLHKVACATVPVALPASRIALRTWRHTVREPVLFVISRQAFRMQRHPYKWVIWAEKPMAHERRDPRPPSLSRPGEVISCPRPDEGLLPDEPRTGWGLTAL